MTKEINTHLYAALTALLNAHVDNNGTLEYSSKDYGYINDELDCLAVKYFGQKPEGDEQQRNYDDLHNQENGELISDAFAFELLMARFNNTYFPEIG